MGLRLGMFFAPDTIKPLGQIPKFLLKGGAPQFYNLSIARKEMADNSSKKQNKNNKGWSFDERKG